MKTLNNFDNIQQYKDAKEKLLINEKARENWCIADGQNIKNGTTVPSEISKTFPYADVVTNELISKIETWEFINEKPEKYFIYIDEREKVATTWTGDLLGWVYFGKEYRGNMGDKRQSVDIKAINGLTYFGTYYKSSGSYARIKAKK